MDYNLGNVQNVLFDVSTLFHAFSKEVEFSDIRLITQETSKDKLAIWMLEFVHELKRSQDALKTAAVKIDQL